MFLDYKYENTSAIVTFRFLKSDNYTRNLEGYTLFESLSIVIVLNLIGGGRNHMLNHMRFFQSIPPVDRYNHRKEL